MEKRAAVMGGGKWYLSVSKDCSAVKDSVVYSYPYLMLPIPLRVRIQPSNTSALYPLIFSI